MARLIDIEGVGKFHAERLEKLGISTQEDLLRACSTPSGRADLAARGNLTMEQVLNWANRADLARIKGIGDHYADLLEAAGVDTVPELAQRNAEHLHARLTEVNGDKFLVDRLPGASEVSDWVTEAKSMPRALHY
jgi:predicted flap endonuclease-1-like 5' DNA nuclease